ncbi:hypothetical protein WJX81_001922 [Elliptochloris bilobata]|uniref:ATPase AAA-type core domain-containing protein n=1 Tax=Elliptochloris bilobata TaxID=381761 RepID=A0AAW1QZ00_9CHLO
MSNQTYDLLWREAMVELVDALELEDPEQSSTAPQELGEWAATYVRHLQTARKLAEAHDQMVQPQKRADLRAALEAALARLVRMNRGLDFVALDEVLVDLKLPPEALEVPVPRCLLEDRAGELQQRAKLLARVAAQFGASAAASCAPAGYPGPGLGSGLGPSSALPLEEALAVIAANERGRQGRARFGALRAARAARQREERRKVQGTVNEWFLENRDPATGAFPDFPDEDAGGSRGIIGPALAPRAMIEAERAARGGKKKKKAAAAKTKAKKPKSAALAAPKGAPKAAKKRKDPTADRSVESLFTELASCGLVTTPSAGAALADHLGGCHLAGGALARASPAGDPDPSPQQLRGALAEFCALPLLAPAVHAVLLYGAPQTGKTALVRAVAAQAGAGLFDLSPRATDGKYPGKAAAMMVFKVAKALAPSVIYIDEVEKVFIMDKKKARAFGGVEAFNRIRKELVKEACPSCAVWI